MSSEVRARFIDVNQFAVIYAGAQKYHGPCGLALVILKIGAMLGIFSWPLYLSFLKGRYREVMQKDGGVTLVIVGLFLVPVCIFIFMNMFILSRYVMPVVIASSPFVFVGLIALLRVVLGSRGRVGFLFIALVCTLTSVLTSGHGTAARYGKGWWVGGGGEGVGENI